MSISIYDKENNLVRDLIMGKPYSKGQHVEYWDGTEQCGELLPPGNYTYKISANNIDISYFTTIANTGNPPDEKGTIRGAGTFLDVVTDSINNYYTLSWYGEMSLAIQKHNFLNNKVEYTLPPSLVHANVHIALCVDENYGYVISRLGSGNRINDLIQRFDLQHGAWILYSGLPNGVININSYDVNDPKANLEFPPITAKGIGCGDGKLYVANTTENRIDIFNADSGIKIGEIPDIQDPTDVALDTSGNIYVVSRTQKVVKKYSSNWDFLGDIIEGLIYPFGVALDSSGNIYVTDQEDKEGNASNQIKIYPPKGGKRPVKVIGIPGGGTGHILPKKFYKPRGIAVDKNGKIFVADTGNGRVVKFDKHGRFLGEEYSEYTQAVWVDETNPFSVYTNALRSIRRHFIEYWSGKAKYIDNWPFPIEECSINELPCLKNIGRLTNFSGELRKIHINNADYLYVLQWGDVYIYKIMGHRLKPVSAIGRIFYGLCDECGWRAYAWIDYNEDEIAQEEELSKSEPWTGASTNNVGFFVDKDGTIYLPLSNVGFSKTERRVGIKKYMLTGFYKDKPVYSLENTEDILIDKGDFVDIYVDDESNYYVVELSGGFYGRINHEHFNVSIRKYSKDEKLLWKTGFIKGDGEAQYIWPAQIISDGDFIYVNDRTLAKVYMYTMDGLYLTSYGGRGRGLGETQDLDAFHAFKNPIDGDTYIFIADYGNNRVPVARVTNKEEIQIITGSIRVE